MDEDRDELIARLHAEGWPVRAIACEVGVSKSRVQQILSERQADEDDDDEEDDDLTADELAPLDGGEEDDDYPPPPPYTHVGRERVWCAGAKGEGGRWTEQDRWVDGNGRSCSELDVYRWCVYRANDDGDYEGAARVRADMGRQIAEYERAKS